MKPRNIITICFLMFVLLVSCSQSKDSEQLRNDSVILKVNATIKLRNDIRLIIESCFKRYPQYNSFILSRCPKKLNTNNLDEFLSNDFLIGPAFSQSSHDKTPLLFFEFKGKKVFIKCGLEELYADSHYQDSIYHSQLIKRGLDSVINDANEIEKDGAVLYVHRSIYFKINKDGSLSKNYRPDTLFLPKLLPSTVKFDSGIK